MINISFLQPIPFDGIASETTTTNVLTVVLAVFIEKDHVNNFTTQLAVNCC